MSDEAHDSRQHARVVEALLFAATEPLDREDLAARLPADCNIEGVVEQVRQRYAGCGVNLVNVAGRWCFRTAPDLAHLLRREVETTRRLSRAALETLAIIAYHQPITRAEVEEVRGVSLSRGTLDLLMEASWIRPCGRRRTPGRPVTYGTTEAFLEHFGLDTLDSLPGLDELKATGLLEAMPPLDEVPDAPADPSAAPPDAPLAAPPADLGETATATVTVLNQAREPKQR